MSSVIYPGFLWGLLGLTIPIAIHLLSRKEGKIIRFGSLRHLRTTESPTFKSIKINELLLLSIRCLLLAIMVLYISELIFPSFWKSEDKKWVLLDPVIEVDSSLEKVLDSLRLEGFELRSLEKGFPVTTQSNGRESDYWTLVEDLKKETNTKVIVFSGNQLVKFKGKRISLPPNVSWVSVPISGKDFLLEAVIQNEQEVKVRKAITDSDNLNFIYSSRPYLKARKYFFEGEDSVLITNPDTVNIMIVATGKFKHDKKIIQASLDAINKSTSVVLKVSETVSDENADWLFWLSDETPPTAFSGVILKEEMGAPFLRQVSNQQWQISKRLSRETAEKYQLTTELFNLIVPVSVDGTLHVKDLRVLPDPVLWSSEGDPGEEVKTIASTHQQLLFVVIMVLFMIERLMAFSKKL